MVCIAAPFAHARLPALLDSWDAAWDANPVQLNALCVWAAREWNGTACRQSDCRDPDSDSMCSAVPILYKFYHQVYSRNGGLNWSSPTPIHGVGCVRPSSSAPERPGKRTALPKPSPWSNSQPTVTGDPKYRFVNCATNVCGSQTYNSIVPLGPTSFGVSTNGCPSASTWMMRVDLSRT